MRLLYFCCIVFLATGFALANAKMDMRAPEPAPSIKQGKVALHSTLEVVPDPKALEARLQISQSTLNELRAGNAGIVGRGFTTVDGFTSKRTMIAGLLMFLAFSVVGVILARKFSATPLSRTQKAIGALVLFGSVIAAATIITHANAGPPGSYRWRNLPQALTTGQTLAGGVDVEIVPDDEMKGIRFRLIVPVKNPAPGEE